MFFVCHITCKVSSFLCSQRGKETNVKNLGSTGRKTACSMAFEFVGLCHTEQVACIQWFGVGYTTVRCATVQCRICTLRNERCVHHVTVIRGSGPYTSFALSWY